jgi:hypothetical protein
MSMDGITQRIAWIARCRKQDVTLKESMTGKMWIVYARGKIENLNVIYTGSSYYVVPKGTKIFKEE